MEVRAAHTHTPNPHHCSCNPVTRYSSSTLPGQRNRAVSNGGISRSGLVLFSPVFSILGLSRFLGDFRDFPGFSRFVLFLFLGLLKHLQGTFPKGSATQPLKLPKAIVLNVVACRNTQVSAKERKRKSAKERKCQKGANERKRALPRKYCKQPGLKQPGLGTPNNQDLTRKVGRPGWPPQSGDFPDWLSQKKQEKHLVRMCMLWVASRSPPKL